MGPEWQYCVTVCRDDWDEIQRWCEINIGWFDQDWYKLGIDPAAYIVFGDVSTIWYFKREADAVLFKLRWA